jgi:hypothetical protein
MIGMKMAMTKHKNQADILKIFLRTFYDHPHDSYVLP